MFCHSWFAEGSTTSDGIGDSELIMRRFPLIACVVVGSGAFIGVHAQSSAQQGAEMALKSQQSTPWSAQNKTSMARMEKAMMSVAPVDSEDQAFVRGMIPHHQGAVDMAKVELAYGHDPRMRQLAQTIVASQDQEIALMKQWLLHHPNAS